ncbi:MAG: hypothetical protein R3B92_01920 [Patescibacteria group bacterium]
MLRNLTLKQKLLILGLFIASILAYLLGKSSVSQRFASDPQEDIVKRAEERDLTRDSFNYDVSGVFIPVDSGDMKDATLERLKLQPHLPLTHLGFQTSVGKVTDIGVYVSDEDAESLVRLEIYGVDYLYEYTKGNINSFSDVQAFAESFAEAKRMIAETGVDPNKLYYVFGTKEYINEISQSWVEQLGLLE